MITGPTTLCMTYAKSGRRVSLGVQIYEQSFPTRRGQRGRNIDGCNCLTDTTFLICNCHADHILPLFRTDRATNMVLSGSVMLCSTLNSPRHIGRMWSSSFWQVLPFGKSQIVLGSENLTAFSNNLSSGANARALMIDDGPAN